MTAYCRLVSVLAIGMGLFGLLGAAHGQTADPIKFPGAQYQPVEWTDLKGWTDDDHAAAFATFLDSCRAVSAKGQPSREMMQIAIALKDVCAHAQLAVPLNDSGARKFFEDNFRPLQISRLGATDGFLTGYYEPIIDGSSVPNAEFTAPLYRRPPNLVVSGSRKLGDVFPSKGAKVGRRVGRRKIVPYYARGEIEDGALNGWHPEICWLRSELDVLYVQIQGSARIRLQDGTILRVNYDSHNGWPYTPIGKVLIDRGIMSKDEVSMQHIREWMETNPQAAKDVLQQNKSYTFFRLTDLSNEDEPIGAEGVPLVPGRSIAIDRSLHVYGTPFFIEADLPLAGGKATTKFRRLMVAQDTGSAIVGPARADIYFGAGGDAARMAGRIKNPGRFVMLLPRALDPVEAGRAMPLPRERPSPTDAATSNADTMPDPTVEEIPLPAARPAIAQAPAPMPKPNRRRKR